MIRNETLTRLLGDRQSEYNLLDLRRLALPFTRVKLALTTQEKIDISTIDEFVLKAINSGIETPDSIEAFLGLPTFVVERSLEALALDRCIRVDPESSLLRLSTNGLETLNNKFRRIRSVDEIEVLHNKLTKELYSASAFPFLRPRELKEDFDITRVEEKGLAQFKDDDADLDVLEGILNTIRRGRLKRQVLQVKEVRRKENGYVECELYIFSHIHTGSYLFKIDLSGEESAPIEEALGQVGFYKNYGPAASMETQIEVDARHQALIEEALQQERSVREFTEQAQALAQEIDVLIQDTRQEQLTAGPEEDVKNAEAANQRIQMLEAQIQELQTRISGALRFIKTYEHPKLFDEALSSATERLMIVSPWINGYALKDSRIQKLQELLAKGVTVYIGYGISKTNEEKIDQRVVERLRKLAKQYPGHFDFRRLGNTHSKILAYDANCFVTGSFNWMSYSGEMRKGEYRDESSCVITDPERVRELFDHEIQFSFK